VGFLSESIPDAATVIRVKSNDVCTSYADASISAPTPSVTPTRTPSVTPTRTPTPTPTLPDTRPSGLLTYDLIFGNVPGLSGFGSGNSCVRTVEPGMILFYTGTTTNGCDEQNEYLVWSTQAQSRWVACKVQSANLNVGTRVYCGDDPYYGTQGVPDGYYIYYYWSSQTNEIMHIVNNFIVEYPVICPGYTTITVDNQSSTVLDILGILVNDVEVVYVEGSGGLHQAQPVDPGAVKHYKTLETGSQVIKIMLGTNLSSQKVVVSRVSEASQCKDTGNFLIYTPFTFDETPINILCTDGACSVTPTPSVTPSSSPPAPTPPPTYYYYQAETYECLSTRTEPQPCEAGGPLSSIWVYCTSSALSLNRYYYYVTYDEMFKIKSSAYSEAYWISQGSPLAIEVGFFGIGLSSCLCPDVI